jgi:hypothetical protein
MVVVYEPDARNPEKNVPIEFKCPVCENSILYRLMSLEALNGEAKRKCPVCRQDISIQVPPEIIEETRKKLEEKIPANILQDAMKWDKFRKQKSENTAKKRKENPLYGQSKEWIKKKKKQVKKQKKESQGI